MSRFFFHLHDDADALDAEGRTFPDLAFARANAIKEARQLMTETIRTGRISLSHRIEIADQDGNVLDVVRFGDAVRIEN